MFRHKWIAQSDTNYMSVLLTLVRDLKKNVNDKISGKCGPHVVCICVFSGLGYKKKK